MKGPMKTLLVWLLHLMLLLLKLLKGLLLPQIKETVKNIVTGSIYAQTSRLGKLANRVTICHKHYCQSPSSAVMLTRERR